MNKMWTNDIETSEEAAAEQHILEELVKTCQELIEETLQATEDTDSSDMDELAVGGISQNEDVEVDQCPMDQPAAGNGNGFDRGLEVEKIVGAYDDIEGSRIYVIKFKGSWHVEHIPSVVARVHIPQIIIDFYLERLRVMEYEIDI